MRGRCLIYPDCVWCCPCECSNCAKINNPNKNLSSITVSSIKAKGTTSLSDKSREKLNYYNSAKASGSANASNASHASHALNASLNESDETLDGERKYDVSSNP